jgi:hypothetical protein
MDKAVAKGVMDALLEAGSTVANTIEDLRGEMADDEFKRYVRAVGEVLGTIQLDLMAAIIREHPDLDPDLEPKE